MAPVCLCGLGVDNDRRLSLTTTQISHATETSEVIVILGRSTHSYKRALSHRCQNDASLDDENHRQRPTSRMSTNNGLQCTTDTSTMPTKRILRLKRLSAPNTHPPSSFPYQHQSQDFDHRSTRSTQLSCPDTLTLHREQAPLTWE